MIGYFKKEENDESNLLGEQVAMLHRRLRQKHAHTAIDYEEQINAINSSFKKWLANCE